MVWVISKAYANINIYILFSFKWEIDVIHSVIIHHPSKGSQGWGYKRQIEWRWVKMAKGEFQLKTCSIFLGPKIVSGDILLILKKSMSLHFLHTNATAFESSSLIKMTSLCFYFGPLQSTIYLAVRQIWLKTQISSYTSQFKILQLGFLKVFKYSSNSFA